MCNRHKIILFSFYVLIYVCFRPFLCDCSSIFCACKVTRKGHTPWERKLKMFISFKLILRFTIFRWFYFCWRKPLIANVKYSVTSCLLNLLQMRISQNIHAIMVSFNSLHIQQACISKRTLNIILITLFEGIITFMKT